jgi:hypothetical protein
MLDQMRAVHAGHTENLVEQVLRMKRLEDEARLNPSDADALGRLLEKFKL